AHAEAARLPEDARRVRIFSVRVAKDAEAARELVTGIGRVGAVTFAASLRERRVSRVRELRVRIQRIAAHRGVARIRVIYIISVFVDERADALREAEALRRVVRDVLVVAAAVEEKADAPRAAALAQRFGRVVVVATFVVEDA